MSKQHGMAAINLEMPDIIPRTEYSAEFHWPLIKHVTGMEQSDAAANAFMNAWDYGFRWNIHAHNQIFDNKFTKMGHANYKEGGADYSNELSQLFEEPEDVYEYDMFEAYGARDKKTLIAEFNANYAAEVDRGVDMVPMTGIYVTLMSGLIELLGWDTLNLAAGIDPRAFGEFANRYTAWIQQYFDALAEADGDVVMVHDDIVWGTGAFLHPSFYREFIFPNYKKLFRPLHEKGKKILYTCDGNFTEFIDDVADCGINGFVLEPLTDMAYIAEKYGKTHCIVGNADTNVLLRGNKAEIEAEVRRCIEIGKRCPGFFMAVGNHIPVNTPVDAALYYDDLYRKMRVR
ncbi:MAG: uroporphyrinogen decarboxylase family protein [Defluviitaleaceae bacterium]|nr:uroporphyrinogen decarboxylase family protein [Defluviitaleaceae bacterium]